MKLLIVTRERAGDMRYGMGKSIAALEPELEQAGIEVRRICQADRSAASIERVERITRLLMPLAGGTASRANLLSRALEALSMGKLAARVAAEGRYTHVHCHDAVVALGLVLFSPWMRRRFSWGITQHAFGSTFEALNKWECPLPDRMRSWLRRLESKVMRSADWVVVPTQSGRAQLAADLGIDPIPATWHVVPHPLPALNLASKEEARARLGWEPDTLYVLSVGQLVALKRFPMLIAACARLERDLQLVLLGEGDTDILRTAASESGLRRPVIFDVTDDIGLYLSAADLYVSTSATESFGLANLEALAAGLPAVCTAVGAVPEVMSDAALLVDRDAAAVAAGMKKIIDNPALRADYRRRALARARTWPNAHDTAKRYESIYRAFK